MNEEQMADDSKTTEQVAKLEAQHEAIRLRQDQTDSNLKAVDRKTGFPLGALSGIVALFLAGVGAVFGAISNSEARTTAAASSAKSSAAAVETRINEALASKVSELEKWIEDTRNRKISEREDYMERLEKHDEEFKALATRIPTPDQWKSEHDEVEADIHLMHADMKDFRSDYEVTKGLTNRAHVRLDEAKVVLEQQIDYLTSKLDAAQATVNEQRAQIAKLQSSSESGIKNLNTTVTARNEIVNAQIAELRVLLSIVGDHAGISIPENDYFPTETPTKSRQTSGNTNGI